MKIKIWVIAITIISLLGLLQLNSTTAKESYVSSQKNGEQKEEIIKELKAKNASEETLNEKKNADAQNAPQEQKGKVYFAKKSHALDANAKKVLNDNATWLKNNPEAKLVIEGHGNEYRSSEKNLILGELRAGSVKSYLIKQGIDQSRLIVVSYGAERSLRNARKIGLKNWRVCFLIKKLKKR